MPLIGIAFAPPFFAGFILLVNLLVPRLMRYKVDSKGIAIVDLLGTHYRIRMDAVADVSVVPFFRAIADSFVEGRLVRSMSNRAYSRQVVLVTCVDDRTYMLTPEDPEQFARSVLDESARARSLARAT